MKLQKIETCLHRREKNLFGIINGWGNCETCISDEKNKYCRGYIPVTHFLFYIEEREVKSSDNQ